MMTVLNSHSNSLSGVATQNLSPTPKRLSPEDEQKLQKAAGDFESILLASMWKSMKQSFGSSEASSDPAHGTLDDWGIEIMSGAVGKAGGLGIGRLILKHLDPGLEKQPLQSASGKGLVSTSNIISGQTSNTD
jgi:Rod binding domain-containing protein